MIAPPNAGGKSFVLQSKQATNRFGIAARRSRTR